MTGVQTCALPIWSEDNGLYRFNKNSLTHQPIMGEFSNRRVYCLAQSGQEILWIGTQTGLLKYNYKSGRTETIPLSYKGKTAEITTLVFGPQGLLWIGTIEQGLITINTDTEKIHRYPPDPDDPHGLSSSGILKIYFDQTGLLWVATRGNGIQYFDPEAPFRYYGYKKGSSKHLSHPSIRAILSDDTDLWIGGYGGLDRFKKKGLSVQHYGDGRRGLSNRNVYSLVKDPSGTLWVGTEGGGLFRLKHGSEQLKRVVVDTQAGIAADHVYELFLAKDSTLYLGTGAGLYSIDKNENYNEISELMENLQQIFNKINAHGNRADSIIKGMLLHSRESSGDKTLTDLNELVDQYINLVYHGLRAKDKKFNIRIEKNYDDTLGKINLVQQDISRVLLNVINNACYAAYKKKCRNGAGFDPTLKVWTNNLAREVEIHVWDNGDGIPPELKDKLFNPFFTTKPSGEGTGLGLSISYDIIVKQHRGEIKFDTKEGEFTEFIISLPKN